MLRRDVLVFEVVRFLKRTLQHVVQRTPHVLLGKTLHFWQASDLALNLLGQRFVGHAQPRQKWRHNASACVTKAASKWTGSICWFSWRAATSCALCTRR